MGTTRANKLRIALLHIAPRSGEIAYNRTQIRRALAIAAGYQADLAVTPELAESGFMFLNSIQLNSIPVFPNAFLVSLRQVAYKYQMNLMIGMPQRDKNNHAVYNTMTCIDAKGTIQGKYHKVHVKKDCNEAWETAGEGAVLQKVGHIPVGLLIGEDTFYRDVAYESKRKGAKLLIAQTAWPKVEWNAVSEWEKCSRDAGLPLIICNRTGDEGGIDFSQSESIVAVRGKAVHVFSSQVPTVFIVDFYERSDTFCFVGKMCLEMDSL